MQLQKILNVRLVHDQVKFVYVQDTKAYGGMAPLILNLGTISSYRKKGPALYLVLLTPLLCYVTYF